MLGDIKYHTKVNRPYPDDDSDLKGKARAVKIPDGHDVNSFFKSNGREAVLDLLGVVKA